MRLLACIILFLAWVTGYAQKSYTDAEGAEFLKQVKLGKEYKTARQRADSFNADKNNIPQSVDFKIRYDKEVKDDQILNGRLTRKLALGIVVEQYNYKYDRRRKKITSVSGGVSAEVEVH